jgi:hypothetical protein
MNIPNFEQLSTVALSAEKLMLKYGKVVDQKILINSRIESISNNLFYLAAAGGLVAIFSAFWIGILSLTFAVIACVLLIYKSHTNLNDHIEINLWLSERARVLVQACVSMSEQYKSSPSATLIGLAISEYKQELNSIEADALAHHDNSFTASLLEYYQKRTLRQRYSSALRNKRNRHGIQELG